MASPPKPRPLYGFFDVMKGEILAVLFTDFFLETVPLHFAFFRSSTRLRFFTESFWRRALNGESGFLLGVVFLAQKCPFLRPENGEEKVLPDLGFFRSSIFVTARFCGGFWAANSVICIGFVFVGSGCVFLYGFTYLIQGVLFSCRSRDSGAVVSGLVFSSLLFLLLLPPFFLGAGLGSFSFSSVLLPTGPRRLVEAGQAEHLLVFCLVFLFSLPGSAPLFLALFFSFFSLSFFLSLSCMYA